MKEKNNNCLKCCGMQKINQKKGDKKDEEK